MAAEQQSQTSLDFFHDAHPTALLQGLQELRSDNQLIDVILCVSGKEIPCHRNVLAACSGYFRAMFCNGHRESKERKVVIHEASAYIVQLLVDYAYTSKVTITEDNAVELMEGANFFQFQPVSDACTKFLSDTLGVKNCLERVNLGIMLMNRHLETKALSHAMKEFAAVNNTPEFLDLTKDQLITLISSDDLNAPEETVYMAVMKWINHDTRMRKKGMKKLMELVRFPFMEKMFFMDKVEADKVIRKCCPDILSEARKYQAFPGEVQSPRTRPRRASGLMETVVIVGGMEDQGEDNTWVYSNSIMTTQSAVPSNTSWVSLTGMKVENNHGFAVAVLGTSDIMVSVGGPQCKDVWLYQSGLDSWSKLAPMNKARDYYKLAVVQGKAYAIGGRSKDVPLHLTADVEVYDRRLNKWTEGVPLPEPRYLYAVAVLDGSIYVMGGSSAENNPTRTVYRFSPGDTQWDSTSDEFGCGMPESAADITASVLNGSIYVTGLWQKVLRYSLYMPNKGFWTVVVNTGTASRCGMAVLGGELYIYGGRDNNNGTTTVLWLDQEDKSLKQVGTMPKGLFGHGCVTILKS
ncbi:kelch-like protein 24 [Branchiostoma lanceolatum]|uniref:kelch-like protein 24 n=1 Tax=Branchiostoma lanceolatum TaxID=7740 RepID=UPI0034542F54